MAHESVEINPWSGDHGGISVLSVNFRGNIYNIWGKKGNRAIWTSPIPFEGSWYGTEGGWHTVKFSELPEPVKREALLMCMS